jgi:hypothetical protein
MELGVVASLQEGLAEGRALVRKSDAALVVGGVVGVLVMTLIDAFRLVALVSKEVWVEVAVVGILRFAFSA